MRLLISIIVIASALICCQGELSRTDSTLLKGIAVIRHGTRYVETPKLADSDDIKYSGELTPVGMRQHNELGRAFNKVFVQDEKFLSPTYQPSELYVQSTDKNRTIQSAQSFLHGFYQQTVTMNDKVDPKYFSPPFDAKILQNITKPDGRISVGNGIQPIPIRTLPYDQDKYLLTHGNTCSAFKKWQEENKKSKEWQEVTEYYQSDMDKVTKIIKEFTKSDLPEPMDINKIYQYMDAILCQFQKGGTNYPEIDSDLFKTMQDISQFQFFIIFFLREYQLKAISTPFYSELFVHLENYIQSRTTHKLVLFFAHDTTINMILNTLGLTGYDCIRKKIMDKTWDDSKICFTEIIKVASNIIFELRKNKSDDQLFISIRYNGEYLLFNEGKDTMLYSEYKKKFTDWQIENWDEVCENINTAESSENEAPNWAITIIVIFALLFGIAAIIAIYLFKKLQRFNSFDDQRHMELSENV